MAKTTLRRPAGWTRPTPEPLPYKLPLWDGAPPLRQSGVVASEQCLRRWVWSVLWGLRPVSRSAALDTGSYLHIGLAQAFQTVLEDPKLDGKGARRLMAQAIKDAHDTMLREQEELRKPAALSDSELRDHLLRARTGLACAVRLYEEFTREVLDRTGLRVLAVEVPLPDMLFLPVGEGGKWVNVPAGGQVDVVLADESGQSVWLIDWKSRPSAVRKAPEGRASYDDLVYPWRMQAWLYVAGVEQMSQAGMSPIPKGARVMGFYHGSIRKPGIRLKRDQSVPDYVKECQEWWDGTGRWIKHAALRAEQPACHVHRVQMTSVLRDSAIRRVIRYRRQTEELLELAAAKPSDVLKIAPMTESACTSRDRPCPFPALCLEPRGSLTDTLRRRFVQTADPLDSDPRRLPLQEEAGDEE